MPSNNTWIVTITPAIEITADMCALKTSETLRSHRWTGPDDLRSFGHRSRLKQMGYAAEDYAGKPVIAILNTWSDLNTCHTHFPQRVQEVKRGVWQAGGFPVEIPVMALSETFMKPSAMMYRNLLAMEVEEVLRCHPVDGAVLMGGCDKTTPALLMGAVSADLPAIYFPGGPMLKGNWNGTTLGSGTDAWKYWAERCAGNLDDCQWRQIEDGIARSARPLHDDGHGFHHDRHRRDAGHDAGRRVVASPPSMPAIAAWPPPPAGGSSRWCGKTSSPRDILTGRGVRQRRSPPTWPSAARPTRSST